MADKSKKTAFAKYAVAAVAALLIIGVTVTTIMIKAKRKDVVVIESNSKSTEESESTSESIRSETKQTKEKSDSNKKNDTSETKAETQKTITETSVSFPVDVNKVTLAQLCAIEGIGGSTAKRILDYRDKVGIIRSMRQLLNVDGIGEKTLAKLEQYLYVSENDKADTQTTTATKKTNKTTSKSSAKTSAKTSKTTAAPKEPKEVNVNKADAQEIAEALLISLENAQKIVEVREKIGGFKAKPEILLSKAISEDEYLRLEKYIII